jgi:hypothetical protein
MGERAIKGQGARTAGNHEGVLEAALSQAAGSSGRNYLLQPR